MGEKKISETTNEERLLIHRANMTKMNIYQKQTQERDY